MNVRFAERYGAFSAEAYAQQTRDAARARSDELRDAYRAGNFAHLCLQDGDDLCVGEERPGDARAVATVRAFPVSMTLPDRLLHAIAKPPATIALSNISPAVTSQQLVQVSPSCVLSRSLLQDGPRVFRAAATTRRRGEPTNPRKGLLPSRMGRL